MMLSRTGTIATRSTAAHARIPSTVASSSRLPSHRWYATAPPPPPPPSPSSQPTEPSGPRPPPRGDHHARHRLLYREVWPPLLRCLGYGSISYFSLHLAWQYLDGQEQKVIREREKTGLQGAVKKLREGL